MSSRIEYVNIHDLQTPRVGIRPDDSVLLWEGRDISFPSEQKT